MDVCLLCHVLSGRGLCVGVITRSEESYRVWRVWVWSWRLDNEEVLVHWGSVVPWEGKERRTGSWRSVDKFWWMTQIRLQMASRWRWKEMLPMCFLPKNVTIYILRYMLWCNFICSHKRSSAFLCRYVCHWQRVAELCEQKYCKSFGKMWLSGSWFGLTEVTPSRWTIVKRSPVYWVLRDSTERFFVGNRRKMEGRACCRYRSFVWFVNDIQNYLFDVKF